MEMVALLFGAVSICDLCPVQIDCPSPIEHESTLISSDAYCHLYNHCSFQLGLTHLSADEAVQFIRAPEWYHDISPGD